MTTTTLTQPVLDDLRSRLAAIDIILAPAIDTALAHVNGAYAGVADARVIEAVRTESSWLSTRASELLGLDVLPADVEALCDDCEASVVSAQGRVRGRWCRLLAVLAALGALEG
jgi:hypothetical protein